jgi:hypothetical protein
MPMLIVPRKNGKVLRNALPFGYASRKITQCLTDNDHAKHFAAAQRIALDGVAIYPALPAKAGHGNDKIWKAWKAKIPASHPSRTLWKSLRDSRIPTASTTGSMSSRAPSIQNIEAARGL